MKNLLQHTDSFEKLEELPNRERVALPGGAWGRYKGRDYPHNKVYRFLDSRVGVSWDDVFSEFVHLTWIKDEDKTREKIGWNVEFNTLMKGGVVCFVDTSSGEIRPVEEQRWNRTSFYVHPITKRLEKTKLKKKSKNKEPEIFRILGNYHQLIKIKGIWHEIKGVPAKPDPETVIIDGLHYKKVKKLPESKAAVSAVYPPFPQKFFGQKVVEDTPKYKKSADGYYLVPEPTSYYSRFDRLEKIGPRELMINVVDNSCHGRYMFRRKLENSVKITLHRQLSSKDLKKYGLKNDFIPIFKNPCPICGNMGDGECFHHKK